MTNGNIAVGHSEERKFQKCISSDRLQFKFGDKKKGP